MGVLIRHIKGILRAMSAYLCLDSTEDINRMRSLTSEFRDEVDKMKVLINKIRRLWVIIDNNDAYSSMVKEMLVADGFEVQCFKTLSDALTVMNDRKTEIRCVMYHLGSIGIQQNHLVKILTNEYPLIPICEYDKPPKTLKAIMNGMPSAGVARLA